MLADAARRTPLLFIDHPVTIAALERFGLARHFDASTFMRIPRLRFFDFVRVERRSAFVVTDSGGSQEECYYLDLPCLVHRVKTERREGLGENAVLSGMSSDVLRRLPRGAGALSAAGRRWLPRRPPRSSSPTSSGVASCQKPGSAEDGIACNAAAPDRRLDTQLREHDRVGFGRRRRIDLEHELGHAAWDFDVSRRSASTR